MVKQRCHLLSDDIIDKLIAYQKQHKGKTEHEIVESALEKFLKTKKPKEVEE